MSFKQTNRFDDSGSGVEHVTRFGASDRLWEIYILGFGGVWPHGLGGGLSRVVSKFNV